MSDNTPMLRVRLIERPDNKKRCEVCRGDGQVVGLLPMHSWQFVTSHDEIGLVSIHLAADEATVTSIDAEV